MFLTRIGFIGYVNSVKYYKSLISDSESDTESGYDEWREDGNQ